MTTTIAIVTGTADRKGPSEDGGRTYPTISGRFDSTTLDVAGNAPLFDTMVGLGDGSVSLPFADDAMRSDVRWFRVTPVMLAGHVYNTETASDDRVVVLDLDNADGRTSLAAFNWAGQCEGAELPN